MTSLLPRICRCRAATRRRIRAASKALFCNTTADSAGLGYTGALLIFGGLLVALAALNFWTNGSRTVLFWAAFVLTRPLGAVVGDFLDKPIDAGGLALSRFVASGALLALIVVCLLLFRQRPASDSD